MIGWWLLFAAIGAAGTWLARRYALARQLFDQPGKRRSHSVPTPRGGGMAIVTGMLIASLALALRDPGQRELLLAFAVGLGLVAAIGLVDDHRPLSPWLRLLVHALAAAIFAGAVVDSGGNWGLAVASFVAIVALTNIWNFMDGINGLAASQAVLLGLALAAAGGSWGLLGAALAALCVGFLPWNFPRARIFLGDVGSGALGFAIAALSALACAQHGLQALLLLLPLSTFVVDAGLTLLGRVLRRQPWWEAHTEHAYQAWARRIGHGRVTLLFGLWTMLGIAGSWFLLGTTPEFMLGTGVAWYMSGALAWWMVKRASSRQSRGPQ